MTSSVITVLGFCWNRFCSFATLHFVSRSLCPQAFCHEAFLLLTFCRNTSGHQRLSLVGFLSRTFCLKAISQDQNSEQNKPAKFLNEVGVFLTMTDFKMSLLPAILTLFSVSTLSTQMSCPGPRVHTSAQSQTRFRSRQSTEPPLG